MAPTLASAPASPVGRQERMALVQVRGCVVLGRTPPEPVVALLHRLGVEDVTCVTGLDLAAALAELAEQVRGGQRLVVVSGDLLAADAAVGQLVDDPSVRTGLLVASGATGEHPVRVRQRRVVSAGSEQHEVDRPSATSLGALVVDPGSALAAAAALEAMSELARSSGWHGDVVDHAAVALVRRQVEVTAVSVIGPATRASSEAERSPVAVALAGLDGERVLLERANRPDDGFYSTFVLRRLSTPVTATALRLGLSPNQITVLSLVIGLGAAGAFWAGSWGALVVGAVLLQVSLVVDCVDGEVARYTRRFSDLGAWLDASTDRVKEYAVYAGLAAGAGADLWLLAAVVMTMQTTRHMWDYDFSRVQRIRESWVPAHALELRDDGGAGGSGATLELSARLNERSWVAWAKKVVHMPIGERWLLISVVAVVGGPRWVLLGLLALGMLAVAYTSAGRVLRSRTWHHPREQSAHWLLDPQLDLGPLADRRHPDGPSLVGAFGWAVPGLLRLLEMGVVLVVTAWLLPHDAQWAFAWLFVVAYHHYDTLYRALGRRRPPRWLVWFGLGVDGRTVLVVGAAALGAGALKGLYGVGSALLLLLFVVVASAQWVTDLQQRAREAQP
jgi:phosphatidylglycerophosphate synthase